MTTTELLSQQTLDAYSWTNRLFSSTPYESWEVIPEEIKSNLSWQCGHLILSIYYHSILVIHGHQPDILKQIPLKEYHPYFTQGEPQHCVGKFSAAILYKQLLLMQEYSIQTIRSVTDTALQAPLEASDIPHPIAATKFEAIDWNIKHTMWHCGQIAVLKRLVDQRFNFGLQV